MDIKKQKQAIAKNMGAKSKALESKKESGSDRWERRYQEEKKKGLGNTAFSTLHGEGITRKKNG